MCQSHIIRIMRGVAFVLLTATFCLQATMMHGQTASTDDNTIQGTPPSTPVPEVSGKPARDEAELKAPSERNSADQGPETVDLFDYLRKLRKKPPKPATHQGFDFSVVPFIGSRPPLGFIFGVGASIEFPLGDPINTRISNLNFGGSFSTSKQMSITWAPSLYGNLNRWQLQGDNHFQLATQETFGLGTSTREEDQSRIDFHSLRIFDAWYFQIIPNLYAGAGIRFARQSKIRPGTNSEAVWESSPFVVYSEENGFNLEDQTSAGPSLDLIYDNRDNQNDPSRGVFADASYRTYFKGIFGGSSQWQGLYVDFRTYRPLTRDARHKLAFWGYGDLVTGGTAPYFSLPATGSVVQGRAGRGYAENRFRGERLLYTEAEYRATLTQNGFFGMVFFVNGETVSSSLSGERLFDSVAVGGGFGFRFRLHKRSKTNLGIDFGFGREGSRGIYLGLAEAF